MRSAAVPRLDPADGLLYTVQRTHLLAPDQTGDADAYASVAVNAASGAVEHSTPIGIGFLFGTLQLAPTIVPGRVLYQRTIGGILRLASSG